MQYRLFIHCALVVLIAGCYALGLLGTLVSLFVFLLAFEFATRLKLFEEKVASTAREAL